MPRSAPMPPARPRVTREDWLAAAREVLVSHGVAEVKVLTLGRTLGVSRSSFYWYFENREDLLAQLLDDWDARNTATLLKTCAAPSATISDAVCAFFRCFIDPALFDQGLDFAVREWARRDAALRVRLDAADAARIAGVTKMFARHGYPAGEADARARILYFMQLGYNALDIREPLEARLDRLEAYLLGFTGQSPDPAAMAAFRAFAEQALGPPNDAARG
ncbi:TetR/AcrR family transcriptional regulator [Ovoidimarina sediminis]|uniref:TetR/AcrR family transcriptional regulator n=1 Tax=Ovoidimarina sediminis TaxID=3079856 RepID=UPI00290FBA76|nr:TetR/AcrR family transcriptional regulator [Rhodophyticola sp. MJ-SS7]MDU8945203.1 TetR/AcrR family transcriptional regulator [Rhodophyticola sp. MJ-SS7]